jgi:hypothetical protein
MSAITAFISFKTVITDILKRMRRIYKRVGVRLSGAPDAKKAASLAGSSLFKHETSL